MWVDFVRVRFPGPSGLPSSLVRDPRLDRGRSRGGGHRTEAGRHERPVGVPAEPLRVDQGRDAAAEGVPAADDPGRDHGLRPQGREAADRRRPGRRAEGRHLARQGPAVGLPGCRRAAREPEQARADRRHRHGQGQERLRQAVDGRRQDSCAPTPSRSSPTPTCGSASPARRPQALDSQEASANAEAIVGIATFAADPAAAQPDLPQRDHRHPAAHRDRPGLAGGGRPRRLRQQGLRPQDRLLDPGDPDRGALRHRHRLHLVLPVPLPRTAARRRGESGGRRARGRAGRRGHRLGRRRGDRVLHGAGAQLAGHLQVHRPGARHRGVRHRAGRAHPVPRDRGAARHPGVLALEVVEGRARGRAVRRRRPVAGPAPGALRRGLRRRARDPRGVRVRLQPHLRPRRLRRTLRRGVVGRAEDPAEGAAGRGHRPDSGVPVLRRRLAARQGRAGDVRAGPGQGRRRRPGGSRRTQHRRATPRCSTWC